MSLHGDTTCNESAMAGARSSVMKGTSQLCKVHNATHLGLVDLDHGVLVRRHEPPPQDGRLRDKVVRLRLVARQRHVLQLEKVFDGGVCVLRRLDKGGPDGVEVAAHVLAQLGVRRAGAVADGDEQRRLVLARRRREQLEVDLQQRLGSGHTGCTRPAEHGPVIAFTSTSCSPREPAASRA